MIVLPTICSQERIDALSIGSKCFSNRKYRIRVDLFEHQMAIAEIEYKGGIKTSGSPFIYFDECKRESVYDLSECLEYLKHDKIARRWFSSVMKPCYEKYILPCGRISPDLALEHENELRFELLQHIDGTIDIEGYENRRVHLWTGEDFIKEHPTAPIFLHREKEELLTIIDKCNAEFGWRIREKGISEIQGIDIFADHDRKGAYVTVHYPKQPLFVLPTSWKR